MNIHKIRATIYRDIREYYTNYSVLTLLLLPLAMAAIYGVTARSYGEMPIVMVYIVIGVIFGSVTANIPLMLYAEENEHGIFKLVIHTKSDLLNSIVGRSICTLIITGILMILSLIILDAMYIVDPSMIVGMVLASLVFLNLGLFTGILSKLQSTSTVYGVVILLLMGMTPIIENFNLPEEHIVRTIAELTPVYQLVAIHNNAGITPYVIFLLWLAVTTLLVYISVVRRTRTS